MRLRKLRDAIATRVAERLFRAAEAAARVPFARERSTADEQTLNDLAAFTRLPRNCVAQMVEQRSPTNFRSEWHATPAELRLDHWYYLAAKTYLFANASHFTDDSFAREHVLPHVPDGGSVLDFGGGAGRLSFALADRGLAVSYFELNSLQRDFVRFQVARGNVGERLRVVDPWESLPPASFDAIVAVDVLEHLDDLQSTLDDQLLPALKPTGVIVENSPFVVNVSNPMHHEDFGFEAHMAAAGYAVVGLGDDGTRTWRRR
jgi:2-polyprenyl-3-methyl-5-hydroxy-6-metoxy-1,4-benzoquinol methylase